MQFGSHVYGTNVPTSDLDFKAVHIPTAARLPLARRGRAGPCGAPGPGRPGRLDRRQYESELMTSPCAREARAQIVCWLVEFLRNRTEPSAIITLAPPGWLLAIPK
jgi:hypothetical protein